MNLIVLVGNLTKDPDVRKTSSGISVCSFTVAVQRRVPNSQGVREADFIPVVAWRQLADLCGQFLAKGRKVAVKGAVQTRTYDAQDGSKRHVTEVIADEVEFLSPRNESQRNEALEPAAQNSSSDDEFTEVEDSELPF